MEMRALGFLLLWLVKRVKYCYCSFKSENTHEGTDELDRAVGKDYNSIFIGDTSFVQVVGNGGGRLVNVTVCECPGWQRRTFGFGHTWLIRM
ncbi:hypothetical protein F4809DRAFT_636387, partial [Biscogniauxia mediterranea]